MIKVALSTISIENCVSLALLQLQQALLDCGLFVETAAIDLVEYDSSENIDEQKEILRHYDIVCFSVYMWNIHNILSIIDEIKHHVKHFFLGGPEITYRHVHYLRALPENVSVILGKGENAIRQALQDYQCGCVQKVYDFRNDITEEHIPVYVCATVKSHVAELGQRRKKPVTLVFQTSEGCNKKCSYCLWRGKKYCEYSLETVLADIEAVFAYDNVAMVYFADSDLCMNRKRGKIILEHLKLCCQRSSIEVIYFALSPFSIDDEIAKLFSENDCLYTSFGIQSLDQRTLDAINRGEMNRELLEKKINIFCKYDNVLCFDLIIGLPYQTEETFYETLDFLLNFKIELLNVFPLYVLPGTEIYDNAEQYGISFMSEAPYRVTKSSTIREIGHLITFIIWFRIILLNESIVSRLNSMANDSQIKKITLYRWFVDLCRKHLTFDIPCSIDFENFTNVMTYSRDDVSGEMNLLLDNNRYENYL